MPVMRLATILVASAVAVAALIGAADAGAAPAAPLAADNAAMMPSALPGLDGTVGALTPRASVGADVTAQYDNDIARSDAAQALVRGLIRDDTTTTPRVLVDIASSVAGAHVFVQGSAGYDFHARNSQLNSQRTDLRAGAAMRIGRCSGALIGGYGVRQSDLADVFGPVTRNKVSVKSVEADAGCDHGGGLSSKVALSQTWTSNSSSLQAIADANVTSVTPTVSYSNTLLGVVSAYGRYDDIVYPNRVDLNRKTAEFDGLAGGAMVRRRITSQVEATLDASYLQLTPRQTSPTRFSGMNYTAALTYAPAAGASLRLDAGRTVKPSVRVDANFDVQDFVKLTGALRLGSRTDLTLGVSQQRDQFANNNLALFSYLSTDTVSDVSAAVKYRLRQNLILSAEGGEARRAANVAAFSYTDWRAGLAAAFTY